MERARERGRRRESSTATFTKTRSSNIYMFGFGLSSSGNNNNNITNHHHHLHRESNENRIHRQKHTPNVMVASKTDVAAAGTSTNTATNNTTIKKKPTTTSASQKLRSTIIQLTCVALVVSGITLIVNAIAHHGIPDIDPQKVHKAIKKAGYLGIVIYILGFGLAELLHLPGLVFVTAGVMCWGHFNGWMLALCMAPLSCTISFLVVRRVGGQALADVQFTIVKRMMSHLDDRPVLTVVGLRTVFFLAPAINYILALSTIRARDFVLGTALGLVLPLTVAVYFIDNLINYMGWGRERNVGDAQGGVSGV